MKGMILAALAAMTMGAAACSSTMHEVQENNRETACEAGCISGHDRCVNECQTRAATGQNPDNASCQLACGDARKECHDECDDD